MPICKRNFRSFITVSDKKLFTPCSVTECKETSSPAFVSAYLPFLILCTQTCPAPEISSSVLYAQVEGSTLHTEKKNHFSSDKESYPWYIQKGYHHCIADKASRFFNNNSTPEIINNPRSIAWSTSW